MRWDQVSFSSFFILHSSIFAISISLTSPSHTHTHTHISFYPPNPTQPGVGKKKLDSPFPNQLTCSIHAIPSLAWMEMYLTLATMVPRFDFSLHETTLDDVAFDFDQWLVGTKSKNGVRVTVESVQHV